MFSFEFRSAFFHVGQSAAYLVYLISDIGRCRNLGTFLVRSVHSTKIIRSTPPSRPDKVGLKRFNNNNNKRPSARLYIRPQKVCSIAMKFVM